jgi:hypothetical protein
MIMASYEINKLLKGIEDVEHAFREKTGDKYKYTVTRNSMGSRVSGLFGMQYDRLLVKQNAYHGIEICFQEKDGKQYLSTANVTPNAFLGSVLGKVGLLDILLGKAIFGTRKQLVADVNEVIVNSFPVTVLDMGLAGRISNWVNN